MDELLTTKEAAEYLKCGESTLRLYRKQGTGPSYVQVGSLIRYLASDLKAWLSANRR